MELIILGSGTYIPELKRHCSSYLVKVNKQNLVFDFGRGALDQLMKLGVQYYDIDAIFITHLHPDHCSELMSFLQIALIEPKELAFRKKEMTIYGPAGIKKVIKNIAKEFDFNELNKPKHKVNIKELRNNNPAKGRGWTVTSFIVKHSLNINCLAYRLESGKKTLAFSGDTKDCLGLRRACKNADLAVIEASLPKSRPVKGHMNGELTGKVAKEQGVKKLVLTHISPYYLNNFDVKKDARKFYKGPVLIAKDLMRVKI
jgi:ribonuclease BN (tRNA processing enzyme)